MGKFNDLTGKKFGRLTALRTDGKNKQGKYYWLCSCECGSEKKVARNELISRDSNSCGCLRKDLLRIELCGQRFGNLIVLEKAKSRGKSSSQFWLCKCDCGREKICSSQHLQNQQITNCGCTNIEENGLIPESVFKKFMENVEITDNCWNWKGSHSRGYGIFYYTKMIKSHRFSYIYHYGIIEKGKIICHKCDNPCCVNPSHLYAGTHLDNAKDRDKRKSLNVR